ncbi:hypothetical protein PAECIP111893_04012 [Paenibacillus plantiphilus]|uniref:Uncharacterized protein n=1 Tax=Paenibacillus plantiphilus TaxID=2905650 RepID=A0ABM9CKT9_9BACL|nr:hypothetical protein PAECIP111893_04012 [Paenibacillus plantiphilus]
MENYKIPARELKETIDSIFVKCGYDKTTIFSRNEDLLMQISEFEKEQPSPYADWVLVRKIQGKKVYLAFSSG